MPEKLTGTLADVHQDEQNSRKHSPHNIGLIEKSIDAVGIGRSGVCDENGRLLAGNGTFEALQGNYENVKVRRVKAEPNEWIVVERTGLTEKQKAQMSVADNRATDTSSFDNDILRELDEEFDGLLKPFFNGKELDDILGEAPDLTLPSSENDKPGTSQEVECPECENIFIP